MTLYIVEIKIKNKSNRTMDFKGEGKSAEVNPFELHGPILIKKFYLIIKNKNNVKSCVFRGQSSISRN